MFFMHVWGQIKVEVKKYRYAYRYFFSKVGTNVMNDEMPYTRIGRFSGKCIPYGLVVRFTYSSPYSVFVYWLQVFCDMLYTYQADLMVSASAGGGTTGGQASGGGDGRQETMASPGTSSRRKQPGTPIDEEQRRQKKKTKVTAAVELAPKSAEEKEREELWATLERIAQDKKIDEIPFNLPLTCMDRPPVDGDDGSRSYEIREPNDLHVRLLMASMLKNPVGDHIPFAGVIDPKQCSKIEDVDIAKLKRGGYNVWIVGGGHSREARQRLMLQHPNVLHFQRNLCFVYVGLTAKEARKVGHTHNFIAGYHKDLTNIEKWRCWRQVYERLGCKKTYETKKACLEENGVRITDHTQISKYDPQLQICMRGDVLWKLQNEVFMMWEQGQVKGEKFKRGHGAKNITPDDVEDDTAEETQQGSKAGKAGKKMGRPKKKEKTSFSATRMALEAFNPRMLITSDNKIVAEPAEIPVGPFVQMGGLLEDSVIPVLMKVRTGDMSLDDLERELKIMKKRDRAAMAFCRGVGVGTWEEAKALYPVHSQELFISQYYYEFEKITRGGRVPPGMSTLVTRALEWRENEDAKKKDHGRDKDPEVGLENLYQDWTDVSDDDSFGKVMVLECDVREMASKFKTRKAFALAMFDFPYGYDVPGAANDDRPFSRVDVVGALENFVSMTSSSTWTVVAFCSRQMTNDVEEAFGLFCNAGIECLVWVKPNVHNAGTMRYISAYEHCVVGWYSESGKKEPSQWVFGQDDDRLNVLVHPAVTKKYVFATDGKILCPYQKPVSLYNYFITRFSPQQSYILDGCSGSGTGAVAGVMLGRNVLVVEMDSRCVSGIRAHLASDIEADAKAEVQIDDRGKARITTDISPH
jgi:hypothetical protein